MEKSRQLILSLEDVGIRSVYVNKILAAVEAEKKQVFEMGEKAGAETFRALCAKEFSTDDNFNSDYLINWVKNLK